MNESNIYPRTGDRQTVYLKHAVKAPSIIVGDYTIYNDFVYNPVDFEKQCAVSLSRQPGPAGDRQVLLHRLRGQVPVQQRQPQAAISRHISLPNLFEKWGLERQQVIKAWDNKGIL